MADIQAHFTLIGEVFDTQLVTEKTGIVPSWIRQKDELLRDGCFFGHTEWGIETKIFSTDDIFPVIEQLSSIITVKPDTLKELANECNAEWTILFDIDIYNKDAPAIYFPPKFIELCGKISAKIGFDTYIYDEA